MIEMSQKKNR